MHELREEKGCLLLEDLGWIAVLGSLLHWPAHSFQPLHFVAEKRNSWASQNSWKPRPALWQPTPVLLIASPLPLALTWPVGFSPSGVKGVNCTHKLLTVPKAQNSMQNLTIWVDQMFLSLETNGSDIFGFWNHPTLLKLCFAQRFPNASPLHA